MSRRASNKSKRTLLALALVADATALWPITRYGITDTSKLFDLPQLAGPTSAKSTVYAGKYSADPRVTLYIQVHPFRWAWQADQPLVPISLAPDCHKARASWRNLALDVTASGADPRAAKACVDDVLASLIANAKAKKGLELRFDTNGNSIWERFLKPHYREMQKKLRP